MASGEGLRGLMPRGLYRAPGSAVVGAQARPAHGFAAAAAKEKSSMQGFLIDFAAGGTSGAIAKTCTAPIERVKLIIQTQDANPRIKSGEVRGAPPLPPPRHPPPSPPSTSHSFPLESGFTIYFFPLEGVDVKGATAARAASQRGGASFGRRETDRTRARHPPLLPPNPSRFPIPGAALHWHW